jgi:uncharacterized protein (DUF58 family)
MPTDRARVILLAVIAMASLVTRYLDPALVERLNALQLGARQVVEGTTVGRHRAPLKGASVEFRQHRAYAAGDEPRRLDWRVLARTDRPYVKEYDEETNLRCAVVLDRSGSMTYGGETGPSKFDYASQLVASLAYLMLAQTEGVGLAIAGERLERWVAPHAGSQQLARVLEELERASPAGAIAPDRALRDVADRLARRSLVIVVSDLVAPIAALRHGIARLRHDRHEVILFRVLHPDERTFPFRTLSRFRGLEGEAAQLAEPALVRRMYLDNFNRHARELGEMCRVLRVELGTFVTDRPMIDSLTTFLRRRE